MTTFLAYSSYMKSSQKCFFIDIDIHHGDAVEKAFYCTCSVFTCSFHRVDPGSFPDTGTIEETGSGKGRNHNLNIPLKPGLSNEIMLKLYTSIIPHPVSTYQPNAIVLQCGADGLYEDPLVDSPTSKPSP